ncbi:MAG TPA: PadR family transcriptional regulator [Microcoleaceae cyanobacterium]|jgi:DNA-binding PadR family transcriptional regulator
MFELATLGLLQQEPLHGYRLKQQLELFMSSCISVNYGTIYPLLKRLEERGAIVVMSESPGEAGCSRKIYSITETGRELWKQQMLEHPHESWVNSRSRFMIKYFFFNHLEPSERVKLLNHRLMTCQLRLEKQEREPLSGDRYKALAWHRCLDVLRDEIGWLEEQLTVE